MTKCRSTLTEQERPHGLFREFTNETVELSHKCSTARFTTPKSLIKYMVCLMVGLSGGIQKKTEDICTKCNGGQLSAQNSQP